MFSVRVVNLGDTLTSIGKFDTEFNTKLKKIILSNAYQIERNAKKRVPVDTGKLRSSIRVQIYLGGLSVDVGSDLPMAKYVEYGTPPHRSSKDHDVFVAAIKAWSRRHGKESYWYPILHKIQTHGTQPRPYLNNSFNEQRSKINDDISSLVNTKELI